MKKLVNFFTTVSVGYIAGLLFAKKSGKELRKDLKDSKNPAKTMFKAMKDADLDAIRELKEWAQKSPEIQNLLKIGKAELNKFVSAAKDLSDDGIDFAKEKMEDLSSEAKKAAQELEKVAKKKSKVMIKKGMKFKNEIEKDAKKGIKKIAKKLKK